MHRSSSSGKTNAWIDSRTELDFLEVRDFVPKTCRIAPERLAALFEQRMVFLNSLQNAEAKHLCRTCRMRFDKT